MTSIPEPSDSPSNIHLGLCLSGGGFRATFFHLGVVRFLWETGLLKYVRQICAVSGGSILAAHLVQNWGRYLGDEQSFLQVAHELIKFGGLDVRGRIVRRWFLGLPLTLFRRTRLLQYYYSRLLDGATLKSLGAPAGVPKCPEVHLLATSMTTGNLCSFTKDGFSVDDGFTTKHYQAGLLPLALAVAASSAFPPLFPPVRLSRDDLHASVAEFPYDHDYLTDGGVFDNLGVRKIHRLSESPAVPLDCVLISDASAGFDWDVEGRFSILVSRTVRATNILMKRVSDLEQEHVQDASRLHRSAFGLLSIDNMVNPDEYPNALDLDLQKRVRKIRTDLDSFSSDEIDCLIRHGYAVAEKVLGGSDQATRDRLRLPPLAERSASRWDPLPRLGRTPSLKELAKRIEASRSTRLRMWNAQDWASWILALVIIGPPLAVGAWWYEKVVVLKTREMSVTERSGAVARVATGSDVTVRVPFATGRGPSGLASPDEVFSGERGGLSGGEALISIPRAHQIGIVERPMFEIGAAKASMHVVLLTVERTDVERVARKIKEMDTLPSNKHRGVLVFVPGGSTTFAEGARRTAILKYDLRLEQVPLLFSWPSKGSWFGYLRDEESAAWSVPMFERVLRTVVEDVGAPQIDIVSSYVGGRIVLEALANLSKDSNVGRPRFREIVFVFPDIDTEVFRGFAPSLVAMSRRSTIYISKDHPLLLASKKVHGGPRLGTGDGLENGVRGIDVVELPAGKGGVYLPPDPLSDLKAVLQGMPPEQRLGIERLGDGRWMLK